MTEIKNNTSLIFITILTDNKKDILNKDYR